MNQETETPQKGKASIGSPLRLHPSIRATKNKLIIIKQKCPYCNHHKALLTDTKCKCSKCKKEVNI